MLITYNIYTNTMSVSTFFKRIHISQIISLVGFVGVLVVVGVLLGRGLGEVGDIAAQDEISGLGEVAGLQSSYPQEFIGSIPLQAAQGFDGEYFTYTDTTSGFVIQDTQSFQEVSEAEFRLPFYWQELYQGEAFATDVEVFVVSKPFDDFVSGIRYGLGDGFVTEHQVRGVQRTTGFENSFVHQAYVDLENGTTLVFELRESTPGYPSSLSNYIAGMNLL